MPDPVTLTAEDRTAYVGNALSGATFSPCRQYRYSLWRRFSPLLGSNLACFIGLNPSKADETEDDPTIRRCIGFAKSWGCDGIVMLNLFAFRATVPADMKAVDDPVGRLNDDCLRAVASICHPVVCCWGVHGSHKGRDGHVKNLLRQECKRSVWHLGLTTGGHPKHPLRLPANTELERWKR